MTQTVVATSNKCNSFWCAEVWRKILGAFPIMSHHPKILGTCSPSFRFQCLWMHGLETSDFCVI